MVEREYRSKDEFMEVDDPHNYIASMLNEHVLNLYKSNQAPHHRLLLKKGDICIVLRTLQLQEHVPTNTRVKIDRLGERIIRVQVLNTNQYILIPRIRFLVKIRYCCCQSLLSVSLQFHVRYTPSYELTRTQFPLRLAYSLTFNKAQGQTCDAVLVDLRKLVFSHGFIYVAFSRVRSLRNLMILTTPEQVEEGAAIVTNIVYPELLLTPASPPTQSSSMSAGGSSSSSSSSSSSTSPSRPMQSSSTSAVDSSSSSAINWDSLFEFTQRIGSEPVAKRRK